MSEAQVQLGFDVSIEAGGKAANAKPLMQRWVCKAGYAKAATSFVLFSPR